MFVNITMHIPSEEHDHFVYIPQDIVSWGARMQTTLESQAGIDMSVDTLAHGCDGVAVMLHPEPQSGDPAFPFDWLETGKAFGFVLSKPKLAEMIRMLQCAYDNFD
jgi:hypothetical protein